MTYNVLLKRPDGSKIIHGNALEVLKDLPSNSVDCVITSPPYWQKRVYGEECIVKWSDGWEGELGLEPTPSMYINHLIEIFREIKRVLKPHGNVFVVIDDTYNSGRHKWKPTDIEDPKWIGRNYLPLHDWHVEGIDRKSLLLIPERFAIAMVDKLGFILRNKIIWSKKVHIYKDRTTIGNAMPESVRDRLCHTYEVVYHFVKEPKYYYDLDAVRIPHSSKPSRVKNINTSKEWYGGQVRDNHDIHECYHPLGANPGDVIQINTEPFPEAHFACVDEKTEVLTKNGWKKWYELTLDDEIATFDILDETIHYHKPYNIYVCDYEGELVVIENQWVAQYVTPNHRVLLKYIHSAKKKQADEFWHYVRADSIRPYSGVLIPLSGKYDGEYSIGVERAELLGWIIGDGYIDKRRNVFIYQSKTANPEKVKKIEELLQKCGIAYSKYERHRKYKDKEYIEVTFRFRAGKYKSTWEWIFDWICPETKRPKWKLLHLKNIELQALYNGLVLSDGWRKLDDRDGFVQKDSYTREWFRVLCVHLGLRTTEAKHSRVSTIGTVFVTKKSYAQIHQSDFKECVKRIKYKGIVWCPHVPNTNFVARRKGSDGKYRIFITGNTFPTKLVEFLIKLGCPAQVCKKCGKPRERIVEKITINAQDKRPDRKQIGHPQKQRGGDSVVYTVGWTDCGCNAGFEPGIVLDPFLGSGTTALVALQMGRRFIGVELNRSYCEMAIKRIKPHLSQMRLDMLCSC